MKLNNDLIILDLEATSNQETDERVENQSNNFIIEIGAVYVNKNLEIVSKFQKLVKPEEPVTPFITSITHITPEMVENESKWDVVSKEFETWAESQGSKIKNIRLGAWGTYFDGPLLRKVYKHYGLKFPFSGTLYDAKTLAMVWCALSGNRTDQLSVDKVARHMNFTLPAGDLYHRALVDAEMEAKIYIKAMKDLSGGFYVPSDPGKPYRYIKMDVI
jgi:DNA polymerase III epsilon subunit-like protein